MRKAKKLPTNVLYERAKVLAEQRPESVFQGLRPIASPAELQKASRAKKLLEKRAASNEDTIKDDLQRSKQIPPISGLLTNAENHSYTHS